MLYNTKAINDVLCAVVPSRPVAFRTEESTGADDVSFSANTTITCKGEDSEPFGNLAHDQFVL